MGQLFRKRSAVCHIGVIIVMAILVFGNSTRANAQTESAIRLVLQITVDGLRADLLNRYGPGFGQGGFLRLMGNGTYFTNAHYQHANTETIVGHATLATGTFPSQHGMVGNVWFDREAGELAYNIEDPDHPVIPTRENETKGEQVDPAQIAWLKPDRRSQRSSTLVFYLARPDRLTGYRTFFEPTRRAERKNSAGSSDLIE